MGNTFTNLLYHLVFSTKNRKNLIEESFQDELYNYLGGIIRGEKGKTIAIGGTKDHVHILAKFTSQELEEIEEKIRKMKEQNKVFLEFNDVVGYMLLFVALEEHWEIKLNNS